jgi:hypothetical protein
MYLIRNNTEGKVIIGDLNLILSYGEEKDLETLFSRDTIEKSDNLRKAMVPRHKNSSPAIILVTNTINPAPAHTSVPIIFHTAPDPVAKTGNDAALLAMEERIRKHMAEQMQQILLANQKKPATTDELALKMDLILKAIASGNGAATTKVASDETETFADDDKMLDIHKRTIERLTKNSQGTIQSSKSESKDTGVEGKASELEGLI